MTHVMNPRYRYYSTIAQDLKNNDLYLLLEFLMLLLLQVVVKQVNVDEEESYDERCGDEGLVWVVTQGGVESMIVKE